MDFELPGEDDPRRLAVREWLSTNPSPTGRQLAEAGYVAPHWPEGPPQQLHLDLTVDDFLTAHRAAVALGATPLLPTTPPGPDETISFRVYADPAGHPFCLCR